MNPKFYYSSQAAAEHYLDERWPREIWSAVLQQAIHDAAYGPTERECLAVFGKEMTGKQWSEYVGAVKGAARDWIADTVNEPRRFEWVCEQLGLEPSAVRTRLAEILAEGGRV